MAHVEAAGIGAEGRHHEPLAIGGEAAPADRAATAIHPRYRMQMTGDLILVAARRVAEDERAERQRFGRRAAEAPHRLGIVIARNPDPLSAALQADERIAVAV